MADTDWGDASSGDHGTWWDTAKRGLSYADETAGDAIRAFTNAVTFGNMDRIAGAGEGWRTGKGYNAGVDEQVRLSEAARARSPVTSVVGDVAGAVALPAFGVAKLATVATPYVARHVAPRAVDATARAIGYGVTGAGTGAAQGAGSTYTGNPMDYVKGGTFGAALGAPLGAVGGAVFGSAPARSSAVAPTGAYQKQVTDAAYDRLRAHPAQYELPALSGRGYDIEDALRTGRNAHESSSPQSFRTVAQMHNPPTAAAVGRQYATPADIDHIRKGVSGNEYLSMTPTDQGSAGVVKRALDDFMRKPPPGAAVPGTEHLAADAARTANLAHNLHAGTKRTQLLENMITNAGDTAGATHSGLNLRNELQKVVRSGLRRNDDGVSKFSKAGYNADEQAALREFARGQGRVSQSLAYADKYLGGGGGLGAAFAGGLGGAALGEEGNKTDAALKGLGVSGTGLLLRAIGNRRAATNINELRDLIAQRNPIYAARAANAPMVPGPGSPRAAKALRDVIATEIIKQQGPKRLEINTDDWE